MPESFQLFKNLELLNLTKVQDIERLKKHLVPGFGSTNAVNNILYSMLSPSRTTSVAKTVIVEKEYTDSEFMSCYTRFYCHLFSDTSKRCKRLHFFSDEIQPSDLNDLDGRESYLGFVVVRPITVMPIGRTVLAPMTSIDKDEFVTTQWSYKVNLSGSILSVSGAPFIQQDGRVAACASASLWMATNYLSSKYALTTRSTIEITELATGYDFSRQRSTPGRGLTIPQMVNALSSMGYSPQLYDHPWSKEAKQIIYSCVESKIPAILAVTFQEGHHSLIAIGHTFASPQSPPLNRIPIDGQGDLTYFDNTDWIPKFIIHDDQGSLYGRLQVLPIDNFLLPDGVTVDTNKLPIPSGVEPNINEVHCPIEVEHYYYGHGSPDKRLGNIFAVIAPMPPGVSLLAEDAARKARELLIITNYLYNSPDLSNLVLRTYLESSNQYKESLKYRTDMPDWLRSFYRGKPMSKYVWITEISNKNLFDRKNINDRKMIGEVIMDSAASPFTPSFLAMHIPGYVMAMNPEDENYVEALRRARQLHDDHPYSHSVRVS
jgi:hypothetical protein